METPIGTNQKVSTAKQLICVYQLVAWLLKLIKINAICMYNSTMKIIECSIYLAIIDAKKLGNYLTRNQEATSHPDFRMPGH